MIANFTGEPAPMVETTLKEYPTSSIAIVLHHWPCDMPAKQGEDEKCKHHWAKPHFRSKHEQCRKCKITRKV